MKRRIMFKKTIAALGIAGAAALIGLSGGIANAATNQCISSESCGGADLAYTGHGPLSLAVLNPSKINGGFGYNDEHVGFTTSGAPDGTQDWTLLKDTAAGAGLLGQGDFALEYTPGGRQPAAGLAYCLSIENSTAVVGGKTVERWADVLRWCSTPGRWGTPMITPGVVKGDVGASIANPDPYQLFGLIESPDGNLQLEDIALNTPSYRHGFPGGDDVIDDRAYGGSGTWGIVYPNHYGLNQEGTAVGCSAWITGFNPNDYNCPGNLNTPATPIPSTPSVPA